jgi:hypothetical protein
VSSIDLSLKVVSTLNHRPFPPTPTLPNANPNNIPIKPTCRADYGGCLSLGSGPSHSRQPTRRYCRARKLENDQNARVAEAALRELGGGIWWFICVIFILFYKLQSLFPLYFMYLLLLSSRHVVLLIIIFMEY